MASKLAEVARQHGHCASVARGVCVVRVAWRHCNTGELGMTSYTVRSVRELLTVLGY